MPLPLLPLIAGGALAGGALNETQGGDFMEGAVGGALLGLTGGTASGLLGAGSGSSIGSTIASQTTPTAVATGLEAAGSGAASQAIGQAGQLGLQHTASQSAGQALGQAATKGLGEKALEQGIMSGVGSLVNQAVTPNPTMYGQPPEMPEMTPPPVMGMNNKSNKAMELIQGHLS